jgi:lysyl-tRNA synthetase class 2
VSPPSAIGSKPSWRARNAARTAALIASFSALVTLASALTPPWPGRLALAQRLLDPAGQSVARGIVLATSVGLLMLAVGLARRQRRTWRLAVGLLIVAVVFGAFKGPDEEMAFQLAVLIALWAWRREFFAVADPAGPRQALQTAVLSVATIYGYGLGAIYVHASIADWHVGFGAALLEVTGGLIGFDTQSPPGRFSADLAVTLATATTALTLVVVYLAFRSAGSGANCDPADRADARRLVATAAGDTVAYFALRRDKAYFFNQRRSAMLSYRAINGVALVSCDPLGDPADFDELLGEFVYHCRVNSWRVVAMGVAAHNIDSWRRIGLRTLYIGDEAIVHTRQFSLEGRAIRKVRQSVHRLERAGFSCRPARARDLTPQDWREIDEVSEQWRGGHPERGFSMTMDDMAAPEHGDAWFMLGYDGGGRLGGFAHFVPVPVTGDLSLSTPRRRPNTPNGFMEYLMVETFAWASAEGIERVSLNFAAFGNLLRSEEQLRASLRLARFTVRYFDRHIQMERLHEFNRKFRPEWMARYLAYEHLADIPAAALVMLSMEGLVGWPRPLDRIWLWLLSQPAAARD